MRLSGMFVFRNTIKLGYPVLESLLSIEPALDEMIICADPSSDDETMELAHRIRDKFQSKTRVVEFVWPIGKVAGDGSVIGVATQFCLNQTNGTHVINIQSDEIYPTPLMEYLRDNWRDMVATGAECFRLKVLNTEHNMQFFQGGESWDGRYDTDVWDRGGLFNGKVGGAGYNHSFKMVKKCANTRLLHDAWSFDWTGFVVSDVKFSERWPILHLHDFHRDHYVAIRKNAGYSLWTDPKFGNYKADADRIESTQSEWMLDPKWTRTTSPFMDLLPDVAKPLIGRTRYSINWSLLA